MMERQGVRGSTKLLRHLKNSGRLDAPVDFHIGPSLKVFVPIGRNFYDRFDLDTYEDDFLETLSTTIRDTPGNTTLIDVGADIGLFSLKLLARSPSIVRVVAFEPNGEGFPWLKMNLDRLQIPTQALNAAAADFEGPGRLEAPDARWSQGVETNHTQFFLVSDPDGSIKVTQIDSLDITGKENLVIKIDVEGGELAVLRGATRAITAASHVIVATEAHPSVVARTGVDPLECLRLLSSLRPFRFITGETGVVLNTDKPVFEQLAPDQIYNIIAQSLPCS